MRSVRRCATVAAAALASLAAPLSARATGIFSASAQLCSERIEAESANLVAVVHDQIRASIKENLNAKTHPCSGPFVCAGGPSNGTPCSDNSICGAAGGVPFQCHPQRTAGIAGAMNQAKADLHEGIDTACSQADLNALFGITGSARCEDPNTPANGLTAHELADCIVRSTAGTVSRSSLLGTVGDVLAQGAPDVAVDDPAPVGICVAILGRQMHSGSSATEAQVTAIGSVEHLVADGCVAGNPLCNTKGVGVVGNLIEAPLQAFAGLIPICFVSRTADTGNGTPESGWINLATGQQFSRSAIETTVYIGVTCPVCDAVTQKCGPLGSGGSHAGETCNHLGETDVACPPSTIGFPPIFGIPIDRTTEFVSLAVPANNPGAGVTNPAGTFCGHCDLDPAVGCTKDQDCVTVGACGGGVGSGCCSFGWNVGAFGDATANSVFVQGTRGPFIAQLAGLACAGETGSALTDSVMGFPGPIRSLETRLNVIEYDGTLPTAVPTIMPTPKPTRTTTAPGVATPTNTRVSTKTRTPRPTRTPTTKSFKPINPCGSIDDCVSRCGSDPLCNCLCRNRYCACAHCPLRVCPPG